MSALRTMDVTQAPGTGASVQVPKSYMPEMDRALLDANPRLLDFPASAGNFTPSTLSQILIPQTANRYILGGSSYLNFDLSTTIALSGGETVSGTCRALTYFTGGPTKSAAALIDRITISAAGTTLVDIPNYYIWHNMILMHASNQDYQQSSQVMENSFNRIDDYTAAGSQTCVRAISLPLAVGLFNTNKAFPLWAFNGPLVVNIYWSSFARSIGAVTQRTDSNAAAVFSDPTISGSWTGSALSFRCMCTDVDPEYIMQQRQQMASGKLLVFQYDQAGGMQTNAGTASINFGINCSSLLGVLGAQLMDNDAKQIGSGGAEAYGGFGTTQNFSGSWGYSANEVDSIRVFRDGTQMTSFPLCVAGRDDAFPVLQQTLGVLFSTSNATLCRKVISTSFLPQSGGNYKADMCVGTGNGTTVRFNLPPLWGMGFTRGGTVFAPTGFVWGVSSRKCSDDNISNQGVYCQQLQLVVDKGNVQTGTHYLFYIFSSALAIDASGNCVVKR